MLMDGEINTLTNLPFDNPEVDQLVMEIYKHIF